MDDYISRQAAIDALGEEPEVWTENDEYAQGLNNQWWYDVNALKALQSAQPDTYEALRILDAIRSSGRLDYGDYCDLHDAISEIGGCKEDAVEPYKVGHWVEVHGYVTPGGDPVWACSECGKGIHVYGIEHGTYGADVSDGQWVSCPNCGTVMINEKGN